MEPFQDNVFYLLLWRTILSVLIAVVLMATRFRGPAQALLAGAHVALLFSLSVMVWTSGLDDKRVVKFRAWQMLAPRQQPAGAAGRRWASNTAKAIALPFARAGSAIAAGLAASALLVMLLAVR